MNITNSTRILTSLRLSVLRDYNTTSKLTAPGNIKRSPILVLKLVDSGDRTGTGITMWCGRKLLIQKEGSHKLFPLMFFYKTENILSLQVLRMSENLERTNTWSISYINTFLAQSKLTFYMRLINTSQNGRSEVKKCGFYQEQVTLIKEFSRSNLSSAVSNYCAILIFSRKDMSSLWRSLRKLMTTIGPLVQKGTVNYVLSQM